MHVVQLTAFQVHIPLKKPIRHASHQRTSTENLVVRCVLEDHTEGFGEGVPREYVTGETIDSAIALLQRSDLASQMESCRDFAQAAALAERLRLAPVEGDDRNCQGNAARCALELALLDAYGRHFDKPLADVTPLLAADLHQPRPWVRYSGAITSAQGFKLRFATWRLWGYGFRQVKVKVGIPGLDDVSRLRDIRSFIVGRKLDLRVDANEAWTPAETVERIRAFESFNLSSIEQPVPHAAVAALAAVRRQVKVPIMLDESLCSLVD